MRVRLAASGLKAGKEASLRLTLTDAATGAPVSDVEPFLGAPGHLLLANADLTEVNHVHPEDASTKGPSITFQPLMPAAGLYKLWFQFQRQGLTVTVPFVVSVSAPLEDGLAASAHDSTQRANVTSISQIPRLSTMRRLPVGNTRGRRSQ